MFGISIEREAKRNGTKNTLIVSLQKKTIYVSCDLISVRCTNAFDATRPSRLPCRYIIMSLPLYASIQMSWILMDRVNCTWQSRVCLCDGLFVVHGENWIRDYRSLHLILVPGQARRIWVVFVQLNCVCNDKRLEQFLCMHTGKNVGCTNKKYKQNEF